MSWPVASFAIVFGVLAVGWLAYERSRPSTLMVAVVGCLAAIAALGRDAFVALPEVKPITAMTLVVGYALGPLPGFAVGAIGMLASNIMLGQGPYTPWQMAAWGLVGLAGAAVGRVSDRRAGRVALALACALSALMAKEIMNVYEWTVSANQSLSSLELTVGKGIPFDVTDVVASFLFGLAFAPELARLLGRMRARMTVTWEPTASPLAVLALAACAACSGSTLGAVPTARASSRVVLTRPLAYLRSAQNSDGGFGAARGQRSSELYSAWVAIGLAAAGESPLAIKRNGHTVLDAIRREASTLSGAGDLERTILALHACGASIDAVRGGSLLSRLEHYRYRDGSFEELVSITAFAVFSLRAAGHSAGDSSLRAAARWIERQQNRDGGFSFATAGAASDVDDTAAALQALVDAGARDSRVVARATLYLVRAQNADGGYPQQPGGPSNAQSTAWAIQGLVAAGRNPNGVRRGRGRSPREYLEALIAPNGSVQYTWRSAQTPVWVTAQALIAFAGKTF